MKIRSILLTAGLLGLPTAAQSFDPPVAVDINSDPSIVEVNITAAPTTWQFIPGVDTQVYAYNGTVPGPTIRARVGNTIRVHFTNDLPEPTTVHWHGAEIPAAMDGSHISQVAIQPGESFDYEFTITRASLYWYHPHVRTFDQVERGLYAALLVEDPVKQAEFGLLNMEQHVVIFDDILLDANMEIVPAFSLTDPLENTLYQLNGREGNHLLVNGKLAENVLLEVPNGEPQRWRLLNAANSTFCRLDLRDPDDGIAQEVWQIGTDGGFVETPDKKRLVTSTAIPAEHPMQALLSEMGQGHLLLPGEREDIVFTPTGVDGEEFIIYQNDWLRGRHAADFGMSGQIVLTDDPLDGAYPKQEFMTLRLTGTDPGTGPYVPPNPLVTIPDAPAPVGTLAATFGHGNPDPATGNVTLFAQAEFPGGVLTPLPAPKIDSFKAQDVNVNETWRWQVVNLTHGDHPFHVHGFFFLLEEYEFQDDLDPDNPLVNFSFSPVNKRLKDTIRVPARLGAKGSSRTIARLITQFTTEGARDIVAQGTTPTFDKSGDYTSGGWLFHCHVLEHSGKGMLSFYEVHDANDPFVLLGKELNGTLGKPSLTASGDLSMPGTPVTFDLVNALPNQRVLLIAGTEAVQQSLFGGTLVPGFRFKIRPGSIGGNQASLSKSGMTDGSGCASIDLPNWGSLASGTEVFVQAIFADVGAPMGWAFSNAVSFTVP